MAICIDFELIEVVGDTARYKYGECMKELDNVLEVELARLANGEIAMDTPLNEVVILTSEKKTEFMAHRVFSKVYKHYLATGEYLQKGGYYA